MFFMSHIALQIPITAVLFNIERYLLKTMESEKLKDEREERETTIERRYRDISLGSQTSSRKSVEITTYVSDVLWCSCLFFCGRGSRICRSSSFSPCCAAVFLVALSPSWSSSSRARGALRGTFSLRERCAYPPAGSPGSENTGRDLLTRVRARGEHTPPRNNISRTYFGSVIYTKYIREYSG